MFNQLLWIDNIVVAGYVYPEHYTSSIDNEITVLLNETLAASGSGLLAVSGGADPRLLGTRHRLRELLPRLH